MSNWRRFRIGVVEPKFEAIKEMKPRPVENLPRSLCCLCAEEDAGRENALESLHEAPVMETVLGQLKEFKHLGSTFEANSAAFLFHRESGNPDRYKAVLAEWDSQRELHLRTVRFWDGQKSLILSTHYVANVSKASRNDA